MKTPKKKEILSFTYKNYWYRVLLPRTARPVEEGALADILLINGNLLEKLTLFHDTETSIVLIMKDGKIYKNSVQ